MSIQDADTEIDYLPTLLGTIGIPVDDPSSQHQSTIAPPQAAAATRDAAALRALPRIQTDSETGATAELQIGEVIGKGGMGVIHAAIQVPLAREVAVKSVRPDIVNDQSTVALLREAWITGALQHPNVVPVHTLGADKAGHPFLVMKRIEGVAWNKLMYSRRKDKADLTDEDPLARDLEILVAVSNAIAFAHSRGVIHRDLKSENVMVGRFGEVYVLDWGLAAAVSDEAPEGLPRAADIHRIAGTPQYMAPEMVTATSESIGPATDVFLLGALLHEILTGTFRNTGTTVLDVLRSARDVEPFDYGSDVVPELAGIANKATARLPSDRYPDAGAFLAALKSFLRQRHALQVARRTLHRLVELERLCATDTTEDVGSEIFEILAECRFGFELAMREVPQLPDASSGLRRALVAVCRHEIRHQNLATARVLLREIKMPDDTLVADFEALREEQESQAAKVANFQAMQADLNLDTGTQIRALLSFALSVGAGGAMVVAGWAVQSGMLVWSHLLNVALGVAFLVFGLFTRWSGKSVLGQTAINKRIVHAIIGLGVADIVFASTGWIAGMDPFSVVILHTQTIGLFFLTMSITTDPRLLPPSLIFFVAAPMAALFRPWAWYIMGAANFLGPLWVARYWLGTQKK